MINRDNWNFCYYASAELKGLVSLNGRPTRDDQVQIFYSVTVSDGEDRDIYQKDFDGLSEACRFLNERYAHWKFIDPSRGVEGKCSTCVAKH